MNAKIKVRDRKLREYSRKKKRKQQIPFHNLDKPTTIPFFWFVYIFYVFCLYSIIEYVDTVYFLLKILKSTFFKFIN